MQSEIIGKHDRNSMKCMVLTASRFAPLCYSQFTECCSLTQEMCQYFSVWELNIIPFVLVQIMLMADAVYHKYSKFVFYTTGWSLLLVSHNLRWNSVIFVLYFFKNVIKVSNYVRLKLCSIKIFQKLSVKNALNYIH